MLLVCKNDDYPDGRYTDGANTVSQILFNSGGEDGGYEDGGYEDGGYEDTDTDTEDTEGYGGDSWNIDSNENEMSGQTCTAYMDMKPSYYPTQFLENWNTPIYYFKLILIIAFSLKWPVTVVIR